MNVGTAFVWEKLGQVYAPPSDGSWRDGYAQVPTVLRLPDRLRVFFSVRPPRDAGGTFTSDISWIDVALDDPTTIIGEATSPLLPKGKPGTFDQFGMGVSCAIQMKDRIRLYYSGWMRLVGVPYAVSIGLAESTDGGNTFAKIGDGPLFGRTPLEPYQENAPYVLFHDGLWHMWYGSGIDWHVVDGRFEAIYVIKYAWSEDGLSWVRDGREILPRLVDDECQVRPSVVRIGDLWHMWFSYRYGEHFRNHDRGYRIGYAWSDDLCSWHRDDSLAGIDVSPEGWDSQMISYPGVFTVGDDVFMYYNGNYFGETGFGCAKLRR